MLEFFGLQLGVALVAHLFFIGVEHVVELFADALAVGGFDALGLFHDDVGVHHDEAAVGVIHETGVVGLLDQARDGLGAETDIEHGVHHAGHRLARARAAADEQRVVGVAVFHAHDVLHVLHAGVDFVHQASGELAIVLVIGCAAFRCDGQASRYGQLEQAHFGEVGALATQLVLHRSIAFSGLSAKGVNVLCHFLN